MPSTFSRLFHSRKPHKMAQLRGPTPGETLRHGPGAPRTELAAAAAMEGALGQPMPARSSAPTDVGGNQHPLTNSAAFARLTSDAPNVVPDSPRKQPPLDLRRQAVTERMK